MPINLDHLGFGEFVELQLPVGVYHFIVDDVKDLNDAGLRITSIVAAGDYKDCRVMTTLSGVGNRRKHYLNFLAAVDNDTSESLLTKRQIAKSDLIGREYMANVTHRATRDGVFVNIERPRKIAHGAHTVTATQRA